MIRYFGPDLCVIGAGSGGLAVAAGAAQMGAEVVLVERGAMGGDCLNFGCVPSKSLLAAARVADLWQRGAELGIAYARPRIDYTRGKSASWKRSKKPPGRASTTSNSVKKISPPAIWNPWPEKQSESSPN